MAEYIEREAAIAEILKGTITTSDLYGMGVETGMDTALERVKSVPAADVAPVVRCQNCIHAEPLDRNCEINTSVYMHCKIQRGEETKNVWHKYKKYYKDYSLVDRDGFCDEGERMDGE